MKTLDLRTARRNRGWTMDELEARSGVNKGTISRIESGENTNPGYDTIVALEGALRVRRGALVFGEQVKEVGAS